MNIDSFRSPTYLDCWFLSGATASGKTRVGLELAERLNAEIVALDSMTVYRHMDIGTAKPEPSERGRVPHHMIDIINPDQDFSIAAYVAAVQLVVSGIRGRGKEVLFVGGTPLYLKALLRGIFVGPPADWEFRQSVLAEVAEIGTTALMERLRQVDPLTASKLPANDVRRLIRALEVYKLTGQPISHWQTHFDEGEAAAKCRVFVLQWPRPQLHARIETRVEGMFRAGLLDEVEHLRDQFPRLSRTATQAVGYREVLQHLSEGTPLQDAKLQVTRRTRQFAKRQETWFRGISECRFVPCDEQRSSAELARDIAETGLANGSAAFFGGEHEN
ncbi:MAG TPA: tRNA (adenosine(37)-N6)-dimethylallyltransferase MiaA [Pirellulaceae bacterium]